MTAQVNYVCWTSENVTATIPTEAATPSDAVLLATHAPLRIRRQSSSTDTGASQVLSEAEVLEEFLNGETNNGVRVATVLGESGAGKSHLVRWINAKIPRKQGRHVIYLPKTETSLKDVVEALLIDQHAPELDEIRRRVSSLGSGITPDEMEHKILAELAEALRTAEPDNAYGRALVGDNGLRLFFIDPLFEAHLLRPKSFIKRRAEHALRGRDADEPDVPLEFTAEELPLDIVDNANLGEAALATQKLFRRLVASAPMQAEAVRLLNEHLDVAVTKAASLNVGDIGRAFQQIRKTLVGQEIVLLIEDVALIQGVRRDLLDAIVEVGIVQGSEKYAAVRTMLAVTPSYYREQLPETFRRRAEASSPIYQVDVDLRLGGGDKEQEDLLVDFVGRYLNAARVGKDALEASAPAVPNACQRCPLGIEGQERCNTTFGVSGSDGKQYGLYPYNRAAVVRAIEACAELHGDRVQFNPRKVLSRAIRDVLTSTIDVIRSGNFPQPSFLAEESAGIGLATLPTHVREQIEEQYAPEEAGRLTTLLTFWGALNTQPINEEILQVFSHPPIKIERGSIDPGDSGDAGDSQRGGPSSQNDGLVDKSVQIQTRQIDDWAKPDGTVLPQRLASELRKVVREALISRIDWFDLAIKEPDKKTIDKAIPENARGVSIEGANENLPLGGATPVITVKRTAKNAQTFKFLVYLMNGYPDLAGEALPRLDALVTERVEEAKLRILAELAIDDEALTMAVASLIRGAAACGVLPSKPKDIDFIDACLWSDVSDRGDAEGRTPAWLAAYAEYVNARQAPVDQLLSATGPAQGTGGVYAVDFLRLSKIVRKAKAMADTEDDLEVPSWAEGAHRRLKALIRANQQQIGYWRSLVDRIRALLPSEVTYAEAVDAIVEAVKNGQDQGLVKVPDLRVLQELNTAAKTWDAGEIREVERLLEDVELQSGITKLARLGAPHGVDLERIASYLESSSAWIEAGIRSAEAAGDSVADVDEQLTRLLGYWLDIAKEPTQ